MDKQVFASSNYETSILGENGFAGPRARRRAQRFGGDGGCEVDGGAAKIRRLSDEQARMLESSFMEERKLETGRKIHLAAELGLEPKQVAVWFQNRRARHKSKLLEEEVGKLKRAHDAAVLHRCHLENEVLRLKERLVVTEEELQQLRSAGNTAAAGRAAAGGVVGGESTSSSFSSQPPVDGGGLLLGDDVDDDLMMYVDNTEWFSLYGLM